ncbi:MAG: TonB family protein [Bacteroidota bacterium]
MLLQRLLFDWSSPIDNNRNELVFENRNKQYGAYVIRRDYDQVMIISVLCATALIVVLLSTQFLIKNAPIKNHEINKELEIIKFIDNTPKDKILDPIKKEIEVKPLIKPSPPAPAVRGININNVVLDDHPTTTTNTAIVPDPNANPNAIDNKDPQPPIKLPDHTNTGIGGVIPTNESNEIVLSPDILPSFVGGEEALSLYFRKNIVYPSGALQRDEQAKVIVKFVVEKDGSIGVSEVVKGGTYASLNTEALRVVKKMPKWNPGMSGGKPARVYFYVPINFLIADN